jgi:hypothetical protein
MDLPSPNRVREHHGDAADVPGLAVQKNPASDTRGVSVRRARTRTAVGWESIKQQGSGRLQRFLKLPTWILDVGFGSSTPDARHACGSRHPVLVALTPWIPACAGMTRSHKDWQGIYKTDL